MRVELDRELIGKFVEHLKSGGVYSADGDPQDEQVNDDRRPQRHKGGDGNVSCRVFDLFTDGGDQVVSLKGNEGETHRHHHASPPFGEQGGEVGPRQLRRPKHSGQAKSDEKGQHGHFGQGDDVFRLARHVGAQHVEGDEKGGNDKSHDGDGVAVPHQPDEGLIHRRKITLQQFDEIAAKTHRVQATGYGVGKPKHPARNEAQHTGEGALHKGVTATGFGDSRGQFGVGESRKGGDDAVQGKGDDRRRSCLAGGDAGQHKNAGSNHRAQADHRGVEAGQRAGQSHFAGRGLVVHLVH